MDQFADCKRLTSVQFMRVFNHYSGSNGKLSANNLELLLRDLIKHIDLQPLRLDPRMQALVSEGHEVTDAFMQEYTASVLEYASAQGSDGGGGDLQELDMKTLAAVLPVEPNFLLTYDQKEVLTRVEFCAIWSHYDVDVSRSIAGAGDGEG